MLGLAPESAPQGADMLDLVHADDRERVARGRSAAIAGEAPMELEMRMRARRRRATA